MEPYQKRNRFSLVQKLITSYGAMGFFLLAALSLSLTGLYSVHTTAVDLARRDFPLLNDANKLRDSLQAQERLTSRFITLRSPEYRRLYSLREQEFLEIISSMEKRGAVTGIAELKEHFSDFRHAATLLFQGHSNALFSLKAATERVSIDIDTIYNRQQSLLNSKLEDADRREKGTIRLTLILALAGVALAIAVATFFTYDFASAMGKLKRATLRIAEGDFDHDPQIPAGDEIGELAKDFIGMAARLKVLEQMSLDASPLTRLPGNIAIERILDRRLADGTVFAVCYADLDNFKAYNDHYGYIKGSEVIKMTGEIIYDVVKRLGAPDDFIGHVGGDDFVMVVSAEQAPAISQGVIDEFGIQIRQHYNQVDLNNGAIDGIDRYGVPRSFPIMTISIAVIICQQGEYDSAVDIAKNAAEIKDYVKVQSGSNYLINRRKKNDARGHDLTQSPPATQQ
ncbi:MAG TPA: diguanylate cyclase [Geobacterales bacterium]|nr:diguanylate cyclase [Geobacterales bacterium]